MKKRIMAMALISVVSCTAETIYHFPPITHSTREKRYQRFLNDGRWLMELKGIPDGDETLVCTNWSCPTSIVVNAVRYDVLTNKWNSTIDFSIMTTNVPPIKIAQGSIDEMANGKKARLVAFSNFAQVSMYLPNYACDVVVQSIDPTTNMLFMSHVEDDPQSWRQLVYKNLCVRHIVTTIATNSVATNALVFTSELINAGLPENERIAMPTEE